MKRIISQKGFTLIELLVSVALFTGIMVLSVGCLLVLIDANSRAQNMQQVMTNISFALDSMTREIRTGRSFYCVNYDMDGDLPATLINDCGKSQYLSIVEGGESITGGDDNSRITFRYNNVDQTVERRVGENSWYPITAPGVTITYMYFYVTDTALGRDGDDSQASVTIFIEGYSGEIESVESSFAIETTITKRILDI